jgi:hypothetical protein
VLDEDGDRGLFCVLLFTFVEKLVVFEVAPVDVLTPVPVDVLPTLDDLPPPKKPPPKPPFLRVSIAAFSSSLTERLDSDADGLSASKKPTTRMTACRTRMSLPDLVGDLTPREVGGTFSGFLGPCLTGLDKYQVMRLSEVERLPMPQARLHTLPPTWGLPTFHPDFLKVLSPT